MNCSNCGAGLNEGAKFCSECGTAVALACPNCFQPITSSDKFCSECGQNLQATAAAQTSQLAAAPAPPERPEERRFITALFTDLVGFTPLTESRDAEEVRGMLTQYFDRAREIVDRYGGTIDKFIGDAVMAVWGAETTHDDDAERAVRAGLDLVEAVEDLGHQLGIPELRARSGALSGEAAVGSDGNQATGLIIGDIVNTASRLQSAAQPGTVLVGQTTRDLAEKAIEFDSAGEIDLKGKSEVVPAWRAVRVLAGHAGLRRADGLVPPFVGRTDELRLLKDSLSSIAREGRARLVSIVGQGGIGKSRLISEFWNYADGLSDTTYWHQGRSPAYGEGLAFWALGEMVRQRAGIAETDDDHRTRTKLRTALAEYVPDAADREWIEPRFEALLGLSDSPEGDRAELFAAWRLLFTRISERDPTVMVFEDLHWADDGLLDFIDDLISLANDFPILVVTVARPELLERRPGWGSERTNTISLRVAPLAPATMAELVQGVVVDAPQDLIEGLVERAGGIPLYAVELLRMLHARTLITPDGERFRISGDVTDIETPDSLHGLVGARLDQLGADDRTLLQDAAVLGQSFTIEGLRGLRDQSIEELTKALQPLVRGEILTVEQDPRSPERGQYRFVQSIIREVAHQRISKADRSARHLRVAEYFESLDEPELAGVVASHYLDALEVSPEGTEAEELRARAISGLLAAADRADVLQSHGQVVRLCERGIGLTRTPGERGELLLRAAKAAHANLDERAEDFAQAAFEAFDEAENHQGQLRAATVMGRLLDDSGRAKEAWPVLLQVVDEGETAADAAAMGELARAYMFEGETGEALAWSDRALTIAERLDLIPVFTDVLITKATVLGHQYRMREGMALLDKGLELAREHQLTHSKRRAINNIGYLRGSDDWVENDLQEERLADARRLGEPRELTEVELQAAWTALWALDWEKMDGLVADIDPDSLPPDTADSYWSPIDVRHLLTGDPKEAEQLRESRLANEDWARDAQRAGWVEEFRAGSAFWCGRFEESFDRARALTLRSPFRADIFWSMFPALHLRDPERLEQVRAEIDECPYRGRVIDLEGLATRGAIAAIEGRPEAAGDHWSEACRLADVVWPPLVTAMLSAEAARHLGLDHPIGRERAYMAYEAFNSVGATTMLDIFSEGVLAPEEETTLVGSA